MQGNKGVNNKGKCHSPIFSPFVAHTMFVC